MKQKNVLFIVKWFNYVRKISLLVLVAMLSTKLALADNYAEGASKLIKARVVAKGKNGSILCGDKQRCGSGLVARFYQDHKFDMVWVVDAKLTKSAHLLINTLETANKDGLDPESYHVKRIESILKSLQDLNDDVPLAQITKQLVNLDMTLTDAFFLYANNLSNGLSESKKLYPYWNSPKKQIDFIALLNEVLSNDSLQSVIDNLAPKYPMYAKLKDKLIQYQSVRDNGGWEEIPDGEVLKLGSSGDRVSLLQRRLLISGELESISHKGKFDQDTEKAVIQYQLNNGLYDDGMVSKETLAALNVSASKRIRQIEINMDKIRFLPRDLGDEYVMVNLPKYSLDLVKDGKHVMSMDVAVGDAKHPSCILQSKITYLVLNPYWNIPTTIASTEVWPEIKDNPNVFKKTKLQVFKYVGKDNYKEINPNDVDWANLTTKEFNQYKFRQEPGHDNALGKVKFMFQNPCDIYLHDSNKQEVFDLYRRDFSHGCIRVSEPMNLANYLLSSQKGWSEDDVIEKIDSKQTKIVNLPKPVNIYIMYFTAWVNDDDWVEFRDDIYNFDKLAAYPG